MAATVVGLSTSAASRRTTLSRMRRSTSTRTLTFVIAPTWCNTGPFAAVKDQLSAPRPAAHTGPLSFECLEGESHAGPHVTHCFDDDGNGRPRTPSEDAAVVGHQRAAVRIGTTAALSAARYAVQEFINSRRRSKRSDRWYALSTLFGLT